MSSIKAAQHHHPPKSPQASMDKNLQELGHHEQGLQHAAKLLQDNQNQHQEQILQVAMS